MKEILLEFEEILKNNNLNAFNALNAPLEEYEINSYFDKLNIKNEDLKSLYLWKNGMNINGKYLPNSFFFNTFFMSLESVLRYFRNNLAGKEYNKFIPIFESDTNGDDIFVNNDPTSKEYGKLFLHSAAFLSIDPMQIVFDNIKSMFLTHIELYNKGILFYNSEFNLMDFKSSVECIKVLKSNNKFYYFP